MKWEVQLTGDVSDLQELSDSLDEEALRIFERSGQYFLEWHALENLENHEEVTAQAGAFLQVLSGASRLALGSRTPIGIANTTKRRADGKRETYLDLADTAYVNIRETLKITTSDGVVTVIRPADPIPDWLKLASADPSVAKAMRLIGFGASDWVSLYRLFEVIAEDVGGVDAIDAKAWASKSSIRTFKHTANSPAASGDLARHGALPGQPPANPMDLSEGKALIHHLFHQWLREKLGP